MPSPAAGPLRSPIRLRRTRCRQAVACVLAMLSAGAAAGAPAPARHATALPAEVQAALQQARIPPESLSVFVGEVGRPDDAPPRLAWREREPVNPASLMKLYTTGAALELLGPAWRWSTPLLATGRIEGDTLAGDLVMQGHGDPTLNLERLWLLLRQVQQRGIRQVRGDIVLDGSAFAMTAAEQGTAADFDGEPARPYNVRPDGLMLNLKSFTLSFLPDPARGVVRIASDLTLDGVQIDASAALLSGDCGDWRAALRKDDTDPAHIRFEGGYPASCGEQTWPLAYTQPRSYNARLVAALWRELGGTLGGSVHAGPTPSQATPLFDSRSPPLAAVVRDINKFSNNVMAQQLFLTLGAELAGSVQPPTYVGPPSMRPAYPAPPATTEDAARAVLRHHLRARTGCKEPELVIDNGSGLSREGRSSARCLGAWLQALWASPVMPELMASLPVAGIDGTANGPGRQWGAAAGRAHLKTGTLRDSTGLAGMVLGESGRRYVFVAIANHPNAPAARAALDALVRWTAQDR